MSRLHGRNGIAYVAVNGPGGTNPVASPMAFLSDWSINFTVATVDVTCMGDPNLIWVSGLPDASGDFTGFYDSATAQTYAAAVDGLPRNFYLYPSTTTGGGLNQYFYGTILADYQVDGGVTKAVALKSTWKAASPVARYPAAGVPGT